MKVVVAGSSGLIGRALVEALRADDHEVLRLVRRTPTAADEIAWEPGTPLDPAALTGVQGAINLAGAGVGDKRWTDSYKQTLVSSRLDTTHTLATALAALRPAPSVLVNASAIGYYGEAGDTVLDERAPAGDDFLARLCVRWEAATAPAREAGIRVVTARTGLVVSREGGAFDRMLTIFKLGAGGKLGSGRQWWSPISLTDEVRALEYLLTADGIAGPVNLACPNPLTNAEVTKILGSLLHRPTLLPAPKFGLRLVLGEFATEIVRSQRVVPWALTESGFRFEHPDFQTAARACLVS
ncbi:MAG: TIGR01777 family oxidoreductase [Sporichthyaceae bacterium]